MAQDIVSSALATLLPLAAGRGGDPDEGGGIALILLVIVVAILVIGAVLTLVVRKTRG